MVRLQYSIETKVIEILVAAGTVAGNCKRKTVKGSDIETACKAQI